MEYWWKSHPWRMVQTNLREIDMADIDADRYVASLKEIYATIAMINVAGIISSYPTELPFHFQSEFLTGDSLEGIIEACHRADIRVVARTDFSKVRRPLYEEHPEWACRYGDGIIEDYNGDVHCCINGDYQQIYAPRIMEEAVTKLDVDGIFFNMGGYLSRNYSYENLGMCRCGNCVARFYDMCGLELPATDDPANPAYRAYQRFKKQTVEEHRRMVIEKIRAVRPDIAIDKDLVYGLGFYRQESNTEIDRSLPHWQYSASENTKRVVTSWPDLVSSNASVDFLGFYYRHVAVQPHQQALRLWQNLANCGGLDYYLIGRLDNHRDRSGFEAVKEVFSFHNTHYDDTYANLRPVADVLLVAGGGNDAAYRGWYRVLSESHVLFATVTIDRIESIDLTAYKTVVMPDVQGIGDGAASAIDAFVKSGGTLIATGETGSKTDGHEPRIENALSCLGISATKLVRRDMRSAVLDVSTRSDGRELAAIGDTFVFAEYSDDARGSYRLIPPHNYGPPERCYWSTETDIPGLISASYGEGTAIHVPWKPGELYYREGYDNTSGFMSEVLTVDAQVPIVEGNLPEMVEVTLSAGIDSTGADFFLVQLVNGSGHFGNSYFEPVPVHEVEMRICRPNVQQRAESLRGGDVSLEVGGDGVATIRLGLLNDFEAIKIFAQP